VPQGQRDGSLRQYSRISRPAVFYIGIITYNYDSVLANTIKNSEPVINNSLMPIAFASVF
jgi:hypothetical protein